MGRPGEFRYRRRDKGVWEVLALDLTVFCCGWRSAADALPPLLKRARGLVANQLRTDFATGTWALQPSQVVDWLAHAQLVTVLPPAPPEPVT